MYLYFVSGWMLHSEKALFFFLSFFPFVSQFGLLTGFVLSFLRNVKWIVHYQHFNFIGYLLKLQKGQSKIFIYPATRVWVFQSWNCNLHAHDSLFFSWRKSIDLRCFIDLWRLTKMGALRWDNVVNRHQGWRLVTCIWLHAGIIHLLANMLSLVFIGIRLEQQFGFGMFFLQISKMSRTIRKTELLSLSFASYET